MGDIPEIKWIGDHARGIYVIVEDDVGDIQHNRENVKNPHQPRGKRWGSIIRSGGCR
jgi:hypothetical protein